MLLGAIVAGVGAVLLLTAALLGDPPAFTRTDPRAPLLLFGVFALTGGLFLMAIVRHNRLEGNDDWDYIPWWYRRP